MLVASLLEQRAEVNSCSTKFDKLFNFPPRCLFLGNTLNPKAKTLSPKPKP